MCRPRYICHMNNTAAATNIDAETFAFAATITRIEFDGGACYDVVCTDGGVVVEVSSVLTARDAFRAYDRWIARNAE